MATCKRLSLSLPLSFSSLSYYPGQKKLGQPRASGAGAWSVEHARACCLTCVAVSIFFARVVLPFFLKTKIKRNKCLHFQPGVCSQEDHLHWLMMAATTCNKKKNRASTQQCNEEYTWRVTGTDRQEKKRDRRKESVRYIYISIETEREREGGGGGTRLSTNYVSAKALTMATGAPCLLSKSSSSWFTAWQQSTRKADIVKWQAQPLCLYSVKKC